MSDTTTNRPSNPPSHRLYNVTGDADQARWTEIGAAWLTKDGKGYTISLNAIPLNGRVVMRLNDDKKKEG